MPPRRTAQTRQAPPEPKATTPEPETETLEQATPESPASYLSFGESAEKKIKEDAARVRLAHWEFFVTRKELDRAENKTVIVQATLAFPYTRTDYAVAVPRVSIKTPNGFESYTSPPGDCAIAAAGITVMVRPLFFLIDHRTFDRKDGTKGSDQVKGWLPSSNMIGIMKGAMSQLADDVGIPFDKLDIRNHRLRITASMTGRRIAYAVSFSPKATQFNYSDAVAKFMRTKQYPTLFEYQAFVSKLLAADPRYMISRGGTYQKPVSRQPAEGESEHTGGDEPPF
jgi:hypothetical protein